MGAAVYKEWLTVVSLGGLRPLYSSLKQLKHTRFFLIGLFKASAECGGAEAVSSTGTGSGRRVPEGGSRQPVRVRCC